MRAVVQRCRRSAVTVDGAVVGAIDHGLVVLLGAGKGDGDDDLGYVVDKLVNLRIFADDDGKMNRSVLDVGGGVLLISQFTLYADVRKGRRPAFLDALEEAAGSPLQTPYFTVVRKRDESKKLNDQPGPGIIISASGMATGGRVLHHLERLLPDPRNAVVLTGYQGVGTRGRQLLDGATQVKMRGRYVPVKADAAASRSTSSPGPSRSTCPRSPPGATPRATPVATPGAPPGATLGAPPGATLNDLRRTTQMKWSPTKLPASELSRAAPDARRPDAAPRPFLAPRTPPRPALAPRTPPRPALSRGNPARHSTPFVERPKECVVSRNFRGLSP